jgi:hypothetical protein
VRTLAVSLAVVVTLMPAWATAHQLDEYLHASRLALSRDGIQVEMDLIPGMTVAPQVMGLVDRDRDGRITGLEAEAYARGIVSTLSLSMDGRQVALVLRHVEIAPVGSLLDGTGTISLIASADVSSAPGRHRAVFRNGQQSPTVVYLVNALMPGSRDLVIASQARDPQQREIRVEYDVRSAPRAWWMLAACVMLGALGARGRRVFLF